MSHSNPQVPLAQAGVDAPLRWADPSRAVAFRSWLMPLSLRHQLSADTLRLASADASFRRYFRIDSERGTIRRL